MSETIGEAWVNIMPSTQNFESGLSSSLASLGGVAKTAGVAIGTAITAGVATVSGLTSAVANLASASDEISKSSQKFGVSTEFYQEWSAVLEHSGSSMDAMGTSFKKLATISQNATDDQIEAFEKLGLSMEEVASMSAEDLFTNVIYALQGMEEGNERTALAVELLGRNAQELGPLFNTTAEDTQKMIDTVHELGGVLSETALNEGVQFQDNLQDLQTSMEGLKNSMLTSLLPAFNQILEGLTAFIAGDEEGLQKITEGIQGVMENINSMLPEIIAVGGSIIEGLAQAIIQNLPALMQTGLNIITSLGQYILENLPMLVQTALDLIVQFSQYLTENLPTLIPAIVEVVLTIVETLLDNIDMLIDCAIQLMIALAEGLVQALPKLIEKAPTILQKLVAAIIENAPKILLAAENILMELAGGLIQYVSLAVEKIPEVIDALIQGFLDGVDGFFDVGDQLIQGLWDGIADKSDWICQMIKGLGEDVLNAIKDFLGIHSPSRLFADEVGRFIPEGIAVGIEANAGSVVDAMNDIANQSLSVGADIPADMARQSYTMSANSTDTAILDLLRQYLPTISNNDVSIEINGDMNGIFNAMRKENKSFKKQTGISAFA